METMEVRKELRSLALEENEVGNAEASSTFLRVLNLRCRFLHFLHKSEIIYYPVDLFID